MDSYKQALETIKDYIVDEKSLTDQIKSGEITLEQAFNILQSRKLFIDKLFVQEEAIAIELITFTADLIKELMRCRKQQKEADNLVAIQAQKIETLNNDIDFLRAKIEKMKKMLNIFQFLRY